MPGAKGKSGGPRLKVREDDGRGRPVEKRSLKVDNVFAVKREWPDGSAPLEKWTIKALDRTHITIECGDGSMITLIS